ncbi:MAG TPA: trehalose-6-phosphate synthase, partial [Jatrophihabitantaceae bacterium]|nr:trehalose-6-phosphate synthase [Jatrophihabitantaceae bacterium]
MTLIAVGLSRRDIAEYYEGFCNATIWPLYHDVIVAPEFHRRWWDAYVSVNRRFAEAAAAAASRAATVWVHDYQLQLVPGILRGLRPDLRIGFFNHIPFPGYEIFAQLPRRRQIVEGLLGAGLLGFQRRSDTTNFLRACRRAAGLTTRGNDVLVEGAGERTIRTEAFPISIDVDAMDELATRDDVQARAKEIRAAVGDPPTVLLGVDRLDYTKGILHRLKAFEELLADGSVDSDKVRMVVVATPSRERVEQYQLLREEVEATVGRINGEYATLGQPPVHYLHHSYPKDEMAALFLSADVLLVTSLRDGMNLVAKEYVATHRDERGVLVLSEFAGAADELTSALLINPHDIEGLKRAIMAAIQMPPAEVRRRMRALRRRVRENDVTAWADRFLSRLRAAS